MTRKPYALRDPNSNEGVMFFEEWQEVLVRKGVTKAEADRASANIPANPPKHPSEHFAALLGAIEIERKAIRAEQETKERRHRHKYNVGLAERQKRLLGSFRDFPEAERQEWIDGVPAKTPSLAHLENWAERVAAEMWGLAVGLWEEPADQSAP